MLQWLCHDSLDLWHWRLRWNTLSFTLHKLGIEDITVVLRSRWLRWYGHVQHATSCIKSVTDLPIPNTIGWERPKRHGMNAQRLMSVHVFVAWLPLTHITEMLGEPEFDIAWCCQPHRMGHSQNSNPNLDGWGSSGKVIYIQAQGTKTHANKMPIGL